jgi:hypothetical protein
MTRRNNRLQASVLVTTVIFTALSLSHVDGQQDKKWNVSSVITTIENPESESPEWLLWIGLKNESESARLVCLGSWGYTFHGSEEPRIGAEGSTHTCRSAKSFALVLPSETHFLPVPVGPVDVRLESTILSVRLSLFESQGVSLGECRQFQLTWEGTIKDAVNSGNTLLK